jgi:sugar lactone lactonase YvrE
MAETQVWAVTARALTGPGARLGEGPVWDAAGKRLWWVDILGRRLHCWDGGARQWDLPLMASLAVPDPTGGLTLVTEAGLMSFDPETGARGAPRPFEKDRPGNRSNDSKVSPGGTLVAGTMGKRFEPGAGAFHAIRPDGTAHVLLDGLTIPNGLAWSPDGRWLHHTDSVTNTVMRSSWEEASASVGSPEPFFRTEGSAAPDGAAMDSAGTYWCALWGGRRVVGVAPDGQVVGEVLVAASQVSACAFGGADLKTLFITTAGEGDTAELGGALFAAQMAVAGTAIPPFGR